MESDSFLWGDSGSYEKRFPVKVQTSPHVHAVFLESYAAHLNKIRPQGYKTWVHSQTQNKACVHKQPIIVLYFESETVLKFYNLEAWK